MKTAVLLMAYGSPRSTDEIEPYFTDIRGGRPPGPAALEELTARYAAIGGLSGLNETTERQANGLSGALDALAPGRFQVYVGMKHWHPFIREAVDEITAAGITEVIGLVLAPHYSKKSIGEYESRIMKSTSESGQALNVRMVNQWYSEPGFVQLVADNIRAALDGWDRADGSTRVFFTAHSIPARIVQQGDPYSEQLDHSAALFAGAGGITDYETAWQSASATPEPWLGPDILEVLERYAAKGGKRALIAPVGFVSDHLEVLFDVDIECAQKCTRLGLEMRRIASPNDDPRFLRVLADIVMRYAGSVSQKGSVTEPGR